MPLNMARESTTGGQGITRPATVSTQAMLVMTQDLLRANNRVYSLEQKNRALARTNSELTQAWHTARNKLFDAEEKQRVLNDEVRDLERRLRACEDELATTEA
jgi:chromosome segregation ATPase